MARAVRLRELAAADLDAATEFHRREYGEQVALELIDAVEQGVRRISRSPQLGSLHFAVELGIPDLRAWPLPRVPYIVFYVVTDVEIDVWRILHSRRDLPATLEPPDSRIRDATDAC